MIPSKSFSSQKNCFSTIFEFLKTRVVVCNDLWIFSLLELLIDYFKSVKDTSCVLVDGISIVIAKSYTKIPVYTDKLSVSLAEEIPFPLFCKLLLSNVSFFYEFWDRSISFCWSEKKIENVNEKKIWQKSLTSDK